MRWGTRVAKLTRTKRAAVRLLSSTQTRTATQQNAATVARKHPNTRLGVQTTEAGQKGDWSLGSYQSKGEGRRFAALTKVGVWLVRQRLQKIFGENS